MINRFFKNEYLRNISTVALGVFFSQILTVLLSPILTRLYSPEAFGTIAAFLAVVNILAVISTFRYENVLVLIQNEEVAKSLMVYTIILVACSSLIFSTPILFFENLGKYFFPSNFENWIHWIPLMILVNGLFYTFRNWLIRKKKFESITKANISKSLVLNLVLIVGGYFHSASTQYFLIANILSQSLETGILFFKINREIKIFDKLDFHQGILTLKEYKGFPKYTLPADVINTFTVQNPVLILSFFFGVSTVGIFSLTERVLGIPVKLISNSTLEVYKQKASEQFSTKGDCSDIFLQTFKYLVLVAIIPTIVMVLFSPMVFEFVFGETWKQAGIFAQFLSIKFFFQLSVRPLGFTLLIAGKQIWYLYWQIGLGIFTTLGLFLGVFLDSPNASVLLYSITYSIMYMIYFFISYKASLSRKS